MCPHLHRDPAPWTCTEDSQHRLLGHRHAAFLNHRVLFVQQAEPAALVPQVHSNRERSSRGAFRRPFRTLLTSVTLLHGRSPSLHFECASGELNASRSATGLLIPSQKAAHVPRLHRVFRTTPIVDFSSERSAPLQSGL